MAGDRAGFSLLRRLWTSGWMGRASLFVLLVGTGLTAYFITQPQASDFGTNPTVTPILILSAILFTFGWALGLAVATRLPPPAYFFAAAYLAWFGILPLLALNRIFITLPFFWLLLNGWFVARASANRWRRVWLLLLCLGAGYLTFPGLSLSQFFPGAFNLPAHLVLGLSYFALLANPRVLNTPRPLPRLEWLFLITLVLMGILLGASIVTSPTVWAVDEQTSLALGLSMVGLMWLILSAGAFDGAVHAGEWMTRRVHGIAHSTRGKIILVIVIAVVTVVESVLTNPTDLPLFILFFSNLLDPVTFFTISIHFWFGVIALVGCALALIVQRSPHLQYRLARIRDPHGEPPEPSPPPPSLQ